MLVESSLFPAIKSLDVSVNEQIWFELEGLPDYVFGGVYIPPSNTYSEEHQIKINAMCLVVI